MSPPAGDTGFPFGPLVDTLPDEVVVADPSSHRLRYANETFRRRTDVGPAGDDDEGGPAAEAESVFERGVSSDEEGTGLGLAIVRSIAEAHGWSVELDRGESGGARFELSGVLLATDTDQSVA